MKSLMPKCFNYGTLIMVWVLVLIFDQFRANKSIFKKTPKTIRFWKEFSIDAKTFRIVSHYK